MEFIGFFYAGPVHKERYYTFYKKRLEQLRWNNSSSRPYIISKEDVPYVSIHKNLTNYLKLIFVQFG